MLAILHSQEGSSQLQCIAVALLCALRLKVWPADCQSHLF